MKLLKVVCERLRVPVDCRELAEVVAREHGHIHQSAALGAAALLRLLERCDAIRKPTRFHDVLMACEADARGRLGFEQTAYPQGARLREALADQRVISVQAYVGQYLPSWRPGTDYRLCYSSHADHGGGALLDGGSR